MFITIKAKTLGKYMLIPSILIVIGCMIFMYFLITRIMTTGEYVSWTALSAPVAVLVVAFSSFSLYSSIRYIRNRPFRRKKTLGYVLIGSSLLFLLSSSSIVLFNNITGISPGGWLHPVIGFVAGAYLSLLGAGLISGNW